MAFRDKIIRPILKGEEVLLDPWKWLHYWKWCR